MRVKLLRRNDDTRLLLVYPSTCDEYGDALDRLGDLFRASGNGRPDASRADDRPATCYYMVTTAEQRARWGLPDLVASARARVVEEEEEELLGLLGDGFSRPAAADEGRSDPAAEAAPPSRGSGSGVDALRALATPDARVDEVLGALEVAAAPAAVCETLRRGLGETLESQAEALGEALDRAQLALSLPWGTRAPTRFAPAHARAVLDRTHGGLARVKARLVELLAASPQIRGPLTVEGPRRAGTDGPVTPALVVRPAPAGTPARVPCLAGPRGSGKTSLAVAVADALGRPHVHVTLGKQDAERQIRGLEDGSPGCIVQGLSETGASDPVFILEAVKSRTRPPGRCSTSWPPRAGPRSGTSTSRCPSICQRRCGS